MGVCPSMPVCPTHNQCTFTANSIPFSFACGLNYIGGDIGSSPTSSITECMTLCSTTKSCASMTFVNSICYMKDTSAVASLSPNATSAYVYTPDTPYEPPCAPPSLDTNLLINSDFESYDLSGWTPTTIGAAHDGELTNTSPHTGDWAYHGSGTSDTEAWGVSMSQHVAVTQRRSYTVVVWSKQDKEGNCMGSVTWRGNKVVEFTPGTWYDSQSIMFPVDEVTDGDVAVGFMCQSGGDGAGFYLDSVSMKIGWAG